MSRRRRRRRGPSKPKESFSDKPLAPAARALVHGWADVPQPRDMSYYDMDTEDEEPPPLPTDPDAESGRESWWDDDDWGDD